MQEQTHVSKLKDFCLNSANKLAKERWIYVNGNSKVLKFRQKIYHFRL